MIRLVLTITLMLSPSLGLAKTAVKNSVKLGAKDKRGAYQEVRIKKFKLNLQYFARYMRLSLEDAKQVQIDLNIFPSRETTLRHSFWGSYGEIYFQDGQIKTISETPNEFSVLNEKKDSFF